eukprot:jgi/Tetstr1/447284/TSEL_034721.t1
MARFPNERATPQCKIAARAALASVAGGGIRCMEAIRDALQREPRIRQADLWSASRNIRFGKECKWTNDMADDLNLDNTQRSLAAAALLMWSPTSSFSLFFDLHFWETHTDTLRECLRTGMFADAPTSPTDLLNEAIYNKIWRVATTLTEHGVAFDTNSLIRCQDAGSVNKLLSLGVVPLAARVEDAEQEDADAGEDEDSGEDEDAENPEDAREDAGAGEDEDAENPEDAGEDEDAPGDGITVLEEFLRANDVKGLFQDAISPIFAHAARHAPELLLTHRVRGGGTVLHLLASKAPAEKVFTEVLKVVPEEALGVTDSKGRTPLQVLPYFETHSRVLLSTIIRSLGEVHEGETATVRLDGLPQLVEDLMMRPRHGPGVPRSCRKRAAPEETRTI